MNQFIEHVIEHYLARDKFRFEMNTYLTQKSRGYNYYKSTSHYDTNGNGLINTHAVALTRRSLIRAKEATIVHIHNLLHLDDMLDEFAHVHQDGDIFQFVIEEESDVPTLRAFLL